MTRVSRNLLFSLLLGMLLLAGLALYADVSDLSASMLAFDWVWLPAVLALTLGNYLLRYVKWHSYLGCLDLAVPRGPSALVFLSGLLLSVTPGKLGELLKSALLKESYAVPVTTSAPIVFAERLTDFLALVLLSLFGVASSGYGVAVVVATAATMAVILLFLASRRLSLGTIRLIEKVPVVGRVARKLEELYESVSRLIRPWPLFWTTLLSTAGWFLECVGFWIVLNGFPGVTAGLGEATFIYAFATIFGAVTMLPGGLFATEGSMVGLLQTVFRIVPVAATASAATLLIRFCTLWFAVLVGAVAFGLYRRWRRRQGQAVAALTALDAPDRAERP